MSPRGHPHQLRLPVPSYQVPRAARSSFLSLAPPDPCVGSPATDDSARGLLSRRSDRSVPLGRRRGSKTKGQREGREAAAREEAKLRSHTAGGGGGGGRGSREKKREREREVFKAAAKAAPVPLKGRAQCPIGARARSPPRGPSGSAPKRHNLHAGLRSPQKEAALQTRCQGRMD